ncbi:unnamed protein product [Zymoseptoria tritici ST99CH_3D1]|nr:unnamed protein product [Zymoseptoria tritici ST99CH_3D1]
MGKQWFNLAAIDRNIFVSEEKPLYQQDGRPRLKTISLWSRIVPLLAILLPTLISGCIFALTISGYRSTSTLYEYTKNDRATLQIIVQMVSATLAVPWTFALAQTFNLSTRTMIWEKAISMENLRFWTSTSLTRLDWNLKGRRLILCMLVVIISLVPNFLWTGSLTPQQTGTDRSLNSITVKHVGQGSWDMLAAPGPNCNLTAIDASSPGIFTLCPGMYQSGAILQSGASAITYDGSERNFSKPDNSGYTYRGRSCGMGATIGWSGLGKKAGTVLNYTYTDTGYLPKVSCIYNESSMWVITNNLEKYDATAGFPNLFAAQGWLPNDNWSAIPDTFHNRSYLQETFLNGQANAGWYPLTAFGSGSRLVAVTARNVVERTDRRLLLAIAANGAYSLQGTTLDKIQCEVIFSPTRYDIAVSPLNRTISVQPRNDTNTLAKDPDPTGALKTRALSEIEDVSRTETTIWTSTIGDALVGNFATFWASTTQPGIKHASLPISIPKTTSYEDRVAKMTLYSVEQSLTAMLDDILLRMSLAAISRTQGTDGVSDAEVVGTVAAVRIGDAKYVYANFTVHILALILVVAVGMWQGWWKTTPRFDYADAVGLVVKVAVGQGGQKAEGSAEGLGLEGWDGDHDQEGVRRLEICGVDGGWGPGMEVRRGR